jgi:hypothetical protein
MKWYCGTLVAALWAMWCALDTATVELTDVFVHIVRGGVR